MSSFYVYTLHWPTIGGMMTDRSALAEVVLDLRDKLTGIGIGLPFALKRRDPLEPGRREKEMLEDKLHAVILRYFRKQKSMVHETLSRLSPERKALGAPPYLDFLGDELFGDTELLGQIARLLVKGSKHSVDLFSESIALEMDYTAVNVEVSTWANSYAYEMIKGIDRTTKKALQKVFRAFVETPGMTIGDVVGMLPFTESRSLMIATTEITRVYAGAAQMAGEALQKEFPDVQVIKRWFTNQDDRVCAICAPLHMTVVGVNEVFRSEGFEIAAPPAHVNCRCWINTTTRLANA